ncbi:MAG: hypothetical protein R3B72_50375 [Polyangiaceae bacterium]
MSDGAPTTLEVGPHGLTLVAFARISAELAEGDRPMQEVLDAHGLDETQWNASSNFWMKRMGDDALANGQHATLALVFSDAFAQAQAHLKAIPSLTIEDYAAIVVEIQTQGSAVRPLAQRNLSNADYIRASRHFAALMASDPAVAERFFEQLQKLQPPPSDEVVP